ncbi:MAG: response regulator [Tatlockia sp.]|jgi:two-component system response regulator QseB
MADNLVIILVEDDPFSQKKMCNHLKDLFPDCTIETLANGIQAANYLLSPINQYDLVILDGKLKNPNHFVAQFNGPDVANAMQEKGIEVPVVLFTQDPGMLKAFDEVYGKRLPEIEKPCRKENVSVVLQPVVEAILSSKTREIEDALEGASPPSPGL